MLRARVCPALLGTILTFVLTSLPLAVANAVDWNQVVADKATLARAIAAFYEETQPAPEAPLSHLGGIYEVKLEESTVDAALVGFRCKVVDLSGRSRIFRGAAQLAAEGDSYRVVAYRKRQHYELRKDFD